MAMQITAALLNKNDAEKMTADELFQEMDSSKENGFPVKRLCGVPDRTPESVPRLMWETHHIKPPAWRTRRAAGRSAIDAAGPHCSALASPRWIAAHHRDHGTSAESDTGLGTCR